MVKIKRTDKEKEDLQNFVTKNQNALIELKNQAKAMNNLINDMLVAVPYADTRLKIQIASSKEENLNLIDELEKYC